MTTLLNEFKISLIKRIVNSVGQWSDGIKLASKEGFTSGEMLDYIYANKAHGQNLIGKIIDRIYLSHRGWQLVRERKANIINNINEAIYKSYKDYAKKNIFICDVAAGRAKYILEILEIHKFSNYNVLAEIRDIDERWLVKAKNIADEKKLKLNYRVANALNEEDFKFETKKPDIFVASGFYDWFNDEEVIRKSMKLIYDALDKNGYFVFSVQSGHVDLEMTNAVFTSFNKKQLDMTIWDYSKIELILKDIGFNIVEKKVDKYGNYPVLLVQK